MDLPKHLLPRQYFEDQNSKKPAERITKIDEPILEGELKKVNWLYMS